MYNRQTLLKPQYCTRQHTDAKAHTSTSTSTSHIHNLIVQLRVVCQFSSSSVNFDPNLASCYFPTFFLFSVTSSCHTDAIICYCHSNGSLETITVLCEYVCKCIKIKITFDSLLHIPFLNSFRLQLLLLFTQR